MSQFADALESYRIPNSVATESSEAVDFGKIPEIFASPIKILDTLEPHIKDSMTKAPAAVKQLNAIRDDYKRIVEKNRWPQFVGMSNIGDCPLVTIASVVQSKVIITTVMYITKENKLRVINADQIVAIMRTNKLGNYYTDYKPNK